MNAFNAVPNCLPATKDVYRFITPLAAGPDKDKPIIPAMLVPAMLGMAYRKASLSTQLHQGLLVRAWEERAEVVYEGKIRIFPMTKESHVEFPVPVRPGESIIYSKDAGNRAIWAFVTPRFARWLLTHMTKPVSRQLIDLYFEVHGAARRLKQLRNFKLML